MWKPNPLFIHIVMNHVVQHHELTRHDGRHQRTRQGVYRSHRCPRDHCVRILGVGVVAEASCYGMRVKVALRLLIDVLDVARCGICQHHPYEAMQLAPDHAYACVVNLPRTLWGAARIQLAAAGPADMATALIMEQWKNIIAA